MLQGCVFHVRVRFVAVRDPGATRGHAARCLEVSLYVRLLVIDGHTLCRLGMAMIVADQRDLELVGEAGTVEQGQDVVAKLRPDVVVVDATLPDGDGLDLVRRVRADRPDIGLVVTGAAGSDALMFRAMEAKASAYVAKSAPAPEFLAAIRSAAVAPANFTTAGMADALGRRRRGELLLSPRELQVLALLADGLSVAAIARGMHLSHSTAKTYTSRLYEKLGAGNRAQALMSAVRLGLIQQDDLRNGPRSLVAQIPCKSSPA